MKGSTNIARQSLMEDLRLRTHKMAPAFCEHKQQLVWGEGPLDAKLALIGEAPGREEERLRRPFVGPAGQFLDVELKNAGLYRDQIWITNIVKCRPIKESTTGVANRRPTFTESLNWLDPIMAELKIVDPNVIVCMGSVAANLLIHRNFATTKERGKWFDGPFGIRTMATFHPSYVHRSYGAVLNDFRRDLKEVAEELERTEREPKAHM